MDGSMHRSTLNPGAEETIDYETMHPTLLEDGESNVCLEIQPGRAAAAAPGLLVYASI
jgi:hypothetical protein